MERITDIVLIGAGNVAVNLALTLKKAGLHIVQVYSRTRSSASVLAEQIGASMTTDLQSIVRDAHLYIIAVSDDAIPQIVSKLQVKGMVVHTSGSVSMDVFADYIMDYGVLYPLQTFSKTRTVDFSSIPVCIEANNVKNSEYLVELAQQISDVVKIVPSDQRKVLHLAAVFACNFPNYLYSIAASILQNEKLDFDLLKPLIKETAEKVQSVQPADAQTGPAWRGDTKIMESHMELLRDHHEIRDLYKLISKSIGKM